MVKKTKTTLCKHLLCGLLLLLAGNALAQTTSRTFYFLPPPGNEWLLGSPWLVWKEAGRDTMVKLTADNDRCGWFKISFSGSAPNADAWVWLNAKKSAPDDQVGNLGLAEDPVDYKNGRPEPFNLATKFGSDNNIFFDPSEGARGWDTRSGKDGNCKYSFAAMIYHTNPTANPAFYHWDDEIRVANIVDGIVKGIVKPQLVNGKIQYNDSDKQFKNSTGQTHEWEYKGGKEIFDIAFTNTPGKNVQRCFDMPFTRRDGSWEFDALNLCPDGSADYSTTNKCGGRELDAQGNPTSLKGPVGAFYPPNLMKDVDEYGDYTAGYAAMGGRGTEYNREIDVKPKPCVNMWCFDRGWYGGNCSDPNGGEGTPIPSANRSDPNTVGSLDWVTSSSSKTEIDDYMKTICWKPFEGAKIGNGNNRDRGDICGACSGDTRTSNQNYATTVSTTALVGWETPGTGKMPKVANFMCFESAPATFIYEEGQEFFFRGDDDIWVFINNQLVVDLGGNHSPAPGYVKLDTIKTPERLVPGKEYPINIFFCDRRSSGSNVRISTNMYFAQTTGLYVKVGNGYDVPAEVCLQQSGNNGSCAAVADGAQGPQELCGRDIDRKIEFYLISRKGDERRPGPVTSKAGLSTANDPNCVETGNPYEILCYKGIVLNMQTGKVTLHRGDIKDLPGGTWYLYAKVIENLMDTPPEDVKVATITSQTFIRTAWGEIRDGSTPVLSRNVVCKNPSYAATGELVPICFSGGEQDGNVFKMDDIEAVGGSTFKLETKGLTSGSSKLKLYFDSLGTSPVKSDTTLTIPGGPTGEPARLNSGSVPGVLVLWATGDYVQEADTANYKVNVSGRPTTEEVVIKSVIPKLQWVKAHGSVDSVPVAQQKGAKWDNKGDPERVDGYPAPVWVGEFIKLNVRALAFNSSDNKNWTKTCKTCNFDLFLKSQAKGTTNSGTSYYPEEDGRLIVSSGLRITNGEAALEIAGKRDVQYPYFAHILVQGGASSKSVPIRWDSLQFQEPPVPYPENARIFDVNGDGIGDSLVIAYNRGFHPDTLPNAIEVMWSKDTTIIYGIAKRSTTTDGKDSVYIYSDTLINLAANRNYWAPYIKHGTYLTADSLEKRRSLSGAELKEMRDTIVFFRGPNKDKKEDSVHFSRNVLTKSESAKIKNWVSFQTGPRKNNIDLAGNIDDKIPAIIISARYLADENNKGCGTKNFTCHDKVTLEFSEPVRVDTAGSKDATDDEKKNTFAYMLRDVGKTGWDVLFPEFLPTDASIRYSKGGMLPSENGDSIVSLYFDRYRDGDLKSDTPMPGDSVKFASLEKRYSKFTRNILVDAYGNRPNPKEVGRQLEGRKPFTPDKVPIGEIDPNYPDYVKNITDALDRNGSTLLGTKKDSLFNKDRPIELLPIPPDWDIKRVMQEFPGTIGILLNPDVFNEIADMETKYKVIIEDKDITIYPKVFYHTNLGNFVADRGFSLQCDDPIFPVNDKGQPSCRDSRSKFYIAWDMKDFKGRFVGAGAYVGLYDFYWEVSIPSKGITEKKEKIERRIEMHGVKRVKRK